MKVNLSKLVYAFAFTVLFSCSNNENEEVMGADKAKVSEFIDNYANIVSANYTDTYNTAVEMQSKINAFLAEPSAAKLQEAQNSWLHARDFYGQTEAYREANGPIDNENLLGTEGQINAWPLDEAYIDYVFDPSQGGYVNNGLIADGSFLITKENIAAKNEEGKDDNISTGWHAIEFLLWGQDLNYNTITHTSDNYSVSGQRTYTDYTTAEYSRRRGEYLTVVTDLLVADLKDLNDTWLEGGSYRATFEALDETTALTNILNGVGFISNGEVALERLDPAIDEGQENEHSCFSDNTTQDMWANTYGLHNIIVGSYNAENGTTVSGVSLIDIVKEVNESTAIALENATKETITKLEVLTGLDKNFDEIISEETLGSGGPAGLLSSALKAQGTQVSEAATALGVSITIN
jgi:putative iron-regulated protein